MKRHVRWIIPVLCVPAAYFAGSLTVWLVAKTPGFQQNVGLGFLNLGILLLVFVAIVVAIVFAIRGGVKTYRNWRRAHGHYTPAESARKLQAVHSELGWNAAGRLRATILRHEVPPVIQVWEVVPEPGEVVFYDVPVEYERYYGQDVSYSRGGGFFFGHPAFVVAGLAVNTIGNAARRSSAEAQARSQWREWQQIRLLITSHRLICLANGQWMSFHYSAMTAVYPEVREWALVCEFDGVTSPLRIRGANAPIAAVMTIFGTHGLEAVAQHPSLQALGTAFNNEAGETSIGN